MRARTLKDVLKRAHLSEAEHQRVVGAARIAKAVVNALFAAAHAFRGVGSHFSAKPSYWH